MSKRKTIFSKIIERKTTTDILYQDEFVTAFRDINPKAPVHILLVTNLVIPTMNDINKNHETILGRLLIVASMLARREKIHKNGYRIIVNCNEHGGQEVYHLHAHLLGGKPLGPIVIGLKN